LAGECKRLRAIGAFSLGFSLAAPGSFRYIDEVCDYLSVAGRSGQAILAITVLRRLDDAPEATVAAASGKLAVRGVAG